MAGFDANEVVNPLDWTFEPFVPGAKGRITEPSDAQIDAFTEGMQQLFKGLRQNFSTEDLTAMGQGQITDPAKMLELLDKMSEVKAGAVSSDAAALYSRLCSGHPTKTEIMKLPRRIRNIFFEWVSNEVVNPEAGTAAGLAQVRHLPRAAGG